MTGKDPATELSADKLQLIEKYRLVPKTINNRLYWVREYKNRPDHPYATHRAFRNCHILELVFSVYDLCVAKMTYFKQHLPDYSPCKMDYRSGSLVPCAVWDMEFLVQKRTGIPIDLRNLAEISDIEVFRAMCRWLESQLRHAAGSSKNVNSIDFFFPQQARLPAIGNGLGAAN